MDNELFGTEMPSHFLAMSIAGGVLAVPIFLIMNMMTGSSIQGFMDLPESFRVAQYDFYQQMFSSQSTNVFVVVLLMIMYTLKPIATTNFVLSF